MKQLNTLKKHIKLKLKSNNKIKQKSNFSLNTIIIYLLGVHFLPAIVSIITGIIFAIVEEVTEFEYGIIALSELISNSKVYIYSFSYLLLTIYIFKKYKYVYNKAFKNMKKFNLIKKSIILSIFVWGINSTTVNILRMFGSEIPNNQTIIDNLSASNFLITMITVVIMAPFIEEIIFRYIIQNWAKKFGTIASIFISSIIFSLMHYSGGNVMLIIPYFSVALCFAIIYDRTENITFVFIVHVINNFISLIHQAIILN
jgi:membrane protease YdiL (CAAX protease family)